MLQRDEVQEIRLEEVVEAGRLHRRLRALTTDRLDEAAYFTCDGIRYLTRVVIRQDASD